MKMIFYFIAALLLLGSCTNENELNDSTEVVEEVYVNGIDANPDILKYWKEEEEINKEFREWHQKYPDDTTREVEYMNRLRDLERKYNIN